MLATQCYEAPHPCSNAHLLLHDLPVGLHLAQRCFEFMHPEKMPPPLLRQQSHLLQQPVTLCNSTACASGVGFEGLGSQLLVERSSACLFEVGE
jgi:hypothetical protein